MKFILAVAHFKAGTLREARLSYPDGRTRDLRLRTRPRGGFVGVGYAARGEALRTVSLQPTDPNGIYGVRVIGPVGAEARSSFELKPGLNIP